MNHSIWFHLSGSFLMWGNLSCGYIFPLYSPSVDEWEINELSDRNSNRSGRVILRTTLERIINHSPLYFKTTGRIFDEWQAGDVLDICPCSSINLRLVWSRTYACNCDFFRRLRSLFFATGVRLWWWWRWILYNIILLQKASSSFW